MPMLLSSPASKLISLNMLNFSEICELTNKFTAPMKKLLVTPFCVVPT